MAQPQADVVIYPSTPRLIVATAASLGALALGLAVIFDPFDWALSTKALVASYILSPLLALFGIAGLRRLLLPAPSPVANEAGVYHNGILVGFGAIAWEEIHGVDHRRFKGTRDLVCIHPVDVEKVIARQPWYKRPLLHVYWQAVSDDLPTPIYTDWFSMSGSAEEVCERILACRPASLGPPLDVEDWGG